jgi:hypothetical protein
VQLNRTGIGLIAFFGLIGLAMVVAPIPGEAGWILKSIGVIWFLVAAGLYLFARSQKHKAAHQDWVFQNGIRGRATVLGAGSNTTVNEMPLLKLKLELEIPGQGRRQISKRELMPVFAAMRMQPGVVLPVYVNPQDPDDLILVW